MAEPDFTELRREVAEATRLPPFEVIERRARRRRHSDRLVIIGSVIAVLAVLAPLTMLVTTAGSGPPVLRPPDGSPTIDPTRLDLTAPGRQAKVWDIAGHDIDELYAAIDVCDVGAKSSCDLQVARIVGNAVQPRPIAAGLLRTALYPSLADVRLTPLSRYSLLVTDAQGIGENRATRVLVGGGQSPVSAPLRSLRLSQGDRVVQLYRNGPLYGVRYSDGELSTLPSQPPVRGAVVVGGISPEFGWWVTGHDRTTDQPVVAVSRDLGTTWTVSPLEPAAKADTSLQAVYPPTVVTNDGTNVHVFVNTGGEIATFFSDDAGRSWSRRPVAMPWPEDLTQPGALFGRRIGAVLRPDRSLLVWIEDLSSTVFVESTDGGASYRAVTGVSGRIVRVREGYAAVSREPETSRDARTWKAVQLPE